MILIDVETKKKYFLVIVLGLTALAVLALRQQEELFLIIIGGAIIAPVTAAITWWLGSIHRRCQLLRKILGRNYGVVNLVSIDGRHITSFIKDLTNDYIEVGDSIWTIHRGRIYAGGIEAEKTSEGKEITPSYVAGVPTVFVSTASCTPITLSPEKEDASSREVYAILRAWVITKEAELLRLKKMTKLLLIIAVAASAAAALIAFKTMTDVNQLSTTMQGLQTSLEELKPIASSLPRLIK